LDEILKPAIDLEILACRISILTLDLVLRRFTALRLPAQLRRKTTNPDALRTRISVSLSSGLMQSAIRLMINAYGLPGKCMI
jgi:hypothetical protein